MAAWRTAADLSGRRRPPPDTATAPGSRSGGGDLLAVGVVEGRVDHRLGVVLGLAGRVGELGDQDLASLHDHALLAGRQALLTVADREVPEHLGDLVRVAGVQLLEVVLETPAPIRRGRGLVFGEDLQNLL